MKNGRYKVYFEIDIKNCTTQEDAENTILSLLFDSIEGPTVFPEVFFELKEEFEIDYHTEEEIKELEF